MAENALKKPQGGEKSKAAGFRSRAKGKLVFAFDFGEFSVKVAVFKIKSRTIELRHIFSVENKENLSRIDHSNLRSWRTQIQRALSQHNVVTDDHIAVCTFGGKYFIHRQLEIPFAEEKDRAGLVENEMSQLLALDIGSYVFQHELLDVVGEGDDRKCKVWAVAIPKETCDAALELLRSLKLRPAVMDVHANGVRRFFKADQVIGAQTAGKTAAVIDYGMTNTEMLFLRDGRILADTVLDVGDGRLVSEARNALGARICDPSNPNKLVVSPQEICNILNRAHATAEERSFSGFVEELLNKINTAVQRFDFEHPSEAVSCIYLYGGSPQLGWLVQYISVMTGVPVKIITDTDLFDTEPLMSSTAPDYCAYLNVLNLSLMD